MRVCTYVRACVCVCMCVCMFDSLATNMMGDNPQLVAHLRYVCVRVCLYVCVYV